MNKNFIICFLIFTSFVQAQEWKFLTPVKSNSTISNLEVTPDQTLYIVDKNLSTGIVASSADYGKTWRKLFRNGEYKDIQMLSNQNGYILKSNGVIKTTDNFQTSNYTSVTSSLQAMHFVDNEKGFICGNGGAVYKTINSGLTYTSINISASANLTDVFFVNGNVGFVTGANGTIYKTTNQGVSWVSTNLTNTSLNKILFINDNVGFAVGHAGKIFKTTDQGTNWMSQSSNTVYHLYDIKYYNDNLYVAGQASRVIKSTDLGANWTEGVVSAYPFPDLYCISYINGKVLAGGDGNVYESVNTTAWNLYIKGIYPSNLRDISFSNENQGVVVGGGNYYGVVYQTNDGGNNWTEKKASNTTSAYWSVHMKPSGKGLIVGNGSYYLTSNFGQTWSTSPTAVYPTTALTECWLKSNDDFLIGTNPGGNVNDGLILKTAQGWSQFTNITGILKIEFLDEMIGYAGNIYGQLYKTINGGTTWTLLTSYNSLSAIGKINIISSSKVYVNDFLSTDGGVTWNSVYYDPLSYHFLNDQTGYGMNNGTLYKTTNGGSTWNIILPATYYFNFLLYNINTIQYFPNKIIAVGDLSDIYTLDLTNNLEVSEINVGDKAPSFYPNPTTSKLFFTPSTDINSIQISDVAGRLQPFMKVEKGIDVSTLEKGVYFLRFKKGNQWSSEKIIKQ